MRKFPHRQMCVLMKCHGHSASSLAFHKSSSCGILIGHIWSMFTAPWKVNCTLQSACKTVSFPVLPGPLLSKPATLSFVTHYSHAPPATGWQLVSHILLGLQLPLGTIAYQSHMAPVIYKNQILPKYRDSV